MSGKKDLEEEVGLDMTDVRAAKACEWWVQKCLR